MSDRATVSRQRFVKLTVGTHFALRRLSADAPVLTGIALAYLKSVYSNLESKVRLSDLFNGDAFMKRMTIAGPLLALLTWLSLFRWISASGMDGFCGGLVCNVVDF